MREITSHKCNGANRAINIMAHDEPDGEPIYAPREYGIHFYSDELTVNSVKQVLHFQKGNPAEGVNGITNEALLAIVADRLEQFQKSKFACRENALAFTHIQEAMHWLMHRTNERIQRGVEGTSNV